MFVQRVSSILSTHALTLFEIWIDVPNLCHYCSSNCIPFGASAFIPCSFSGARVTQSLVLCVCFVGHCLFLLAIVMSVLLRFTASDYLPLVSSSLSYYRVFASKMYKKDVSMCRLACLYSVDCMDWPYFKKNSVNVHKLSQ